MLTMLLHENELVYSSRLTSMKVWNFMNRKNINSMENTLECNSCCHRCNQSNTLQKSTLQRSLVALRSFNFAVFS